MIEAIAFGTMKVLMAVYLVTVSDPNNPKFQSSSIVSEMHCKNMQEIAFMTFEVSNKQTNYTIVLCNRFN